MKLIEPDEKKLKFDFENRDMYGQSKVKIAAKKCGFSLLIFVFETFIPWLAGFEIIISLFFYYIVINLMWLLGLKDIAESADASLVVASIAGAVLVILIHLLYHIIIDGIFNASLLIEMNIELYAVFLFYTIRGDKGENDLMVSAKYVFLAAACMYSVMLVIYFAVKLLKRQKINIR